MTSSQEPTAPAPRQHAPRPEAAPALRADALARALGAAGVDAEIVGDATVTLHGITLDSRSVRPGDLYCALQGARAHGADFAEQAAANGAVAVLTDQAGRDRCRAAGLTALVVCDARGAVPSAAAQLLGTGTGRLRTVGVTGTNGKTSITSMVHGTLLELGRPSGVIGTSGTAFRAADGSEHAVATVRTTPEAPEVHGILALMRELGVKVCSMEVSSHAMVLHRADEIVHEVVCFTNLTQDHLDFHGDMESYFAAKASLFAPEHARSGIVCVDDAWGQLLAREARIPVTTYATREGIDADVRAVELRRGGDEAGIGTAFVLERRDGSRANLISPLPGRHYVANTVAVALILERLGHAVADVAPVIARAAVVPGRMELVAHEPVRGIVDYSHTEDSLHQALTTLRALPGTRRVLVVMGAGGDRDRAKRPHMGAVAAREADVVIVTDDNPRSEEPASIRAEVLAGIEPGRDDVHEVAGRAEAIALAARLARPGDMVLVAGKGAETGQDIGGVIHPFDDRQQLRAALARAAGEARAC